MNFIEEIILKIKNSSVIIQKKNKLDELAKKCKWFLPIFSYEKNKQYLESNLKTFYTFSNYAPRFSGVYLIINLLNIKFYVGQSENLGERSRDHFNRLLSGTHRNLELQNDFSSIYLDPNLKTESQRNIAVHSVFVSFPIYEFPLQTFFSSSEAIEYTQNLESLEKGVIDVITENGGKIYNTVITETQRKAILDQRKELIKSGRKNETDIIYPHQWNLEFMSESERLDFENRVAKKQIQNLTTNTKVKAKGKNPRPQTSESLKGAKNPNYWNMPQITLDAAAAINSIPLVNAWEKSYYVNSGVAAWAFNYDANTTIQRKVKQVSNKEFWRAGPDERKKQIYMNKYDFIFDNFNKDKYEHFFPKNLLMEYFQQSNGPNSLPDYIFFELEKKGVDINWYFLSNTSNSDEREGK